MKCKNKNCQNEILNPRSSTQQVCSMGCAIQYTEQKKGDKLKAKKPKKVKLSTLQDKADKAMSDYIRQKFAVDGYVNCVSCGRNFHWKDVDCGHFIPKKRGASIRWVEENVAPECRDCNRFNEAHLIGFTFWMIETYGKEMIEELKEMAKITLSPTQKRSSALEAIDYYTKKLEEL